MRETLFLARRFITRDKRHFIFPFLAIAVGTMGLLVILSVIRGFDESLLKTLTSFYPHVVSFSPSVLESFDGGKMVLSESVVMAGDTVKGCILFGIDEKIQERFSHMIVRGRMPLKGECVVGKDLASTLMLREGDLITVVTGDLSTRKIKSFRYTISGIADFGIYQYNSRVIILNISDALNFALPLTVYYLSDPRKADEVARYVESKTGARALSWLELNATYAKAIKIDELFAMIITIFVVMLSGFGVSNSVLYSVMNRRKQIAILMSMGMSARQVRTIFILIPLAVAFLGILVGVACGMVITSMMKLIRIPIPSDVFLTEHLPVLLKFQDVLLSSLFMMGIAVVFSLLPSSLASKVDPGEVLRSE